MTYSRRIQIAAALSLLLHVGGLAAWRLLPDPAPRLSTPPAPEPIEIDLQPEPATQPERTQLVDVTVPVPEPEQPSPLIAENNSVAMDRVARNGDQPSPLLNPDEHDQLAAAPTPPAEPQPMPQPPAEEESTEEPEEPDDSESPESPQDIEALEAEMEETIPADTAPPEPQSDNEEPIKLAQLDPMESQRAAEESTRNPRGMAREGITNFQAIESEIAPYLRQVRTRVEREWHEMLYTRYSGTQPTKAVIDCAISPSGQLVSVSVVGTENDRIYSALCRDAVQRAGPFGPFPFEVPDIYRDKNLEIRWTFSFL